MALKSMSIEKLVELKDRVEATLASKVLDQRRALESELSKLGDEHLQQTVSIRGRGWTVHDALCRSLAHVAMHVGQIVLLARILTEGNWKWITIPKGKSREYNTNPTHEKMPEKP